MQYVIHEGTGYPSSPTLMGMKVLEWHTHWVQKYVKETLKGFMHIAARVTATWWLVG